MPGLKQHCIPHFLPRGFGRSRSGKNIQVTVYSRTHGIYRAATQGVGAQREFYPQCRPPRRFAAGRRCHRVAARLSSKLLMQ